MSPYLRRPYRRVRLETASLAVVAAFAIFSNPSEARPTTETAETINTQVVSYADLDLGMRAGQAKFRRRVILAAIDVCTDSGFVIDSCFDAAMVDARKQVNRLINAYGYPGARPLAAFVVTRH